MDYVDKEFVCFDCGAKFVFTAAEQAEFASMGYTNAPKRCNACRQARKARQNKDNSFASRPAKRRMYPATCSRCRKETEVPFEPRDDRPVYCRECFSKIQTGSH